MNLKNIVDPKGFRSLALATFYYTGGAILGPLLFFGGAGYFLDQASGTAPRYLLLGLLLAFFVSNVLLFKKVAKMNKMMSAYGQSQPEADKEKGAHCLPSSEDEKNKL